MIKSLYISKKLYNVDSVEMLYDLKNTNCIHINFNYFTVQNINALSNPVTQNKNELCACTSYMLVIKKHTHTQ